MRSDIIWVPELAKLGVLAPLDSQLRRLQGAQQEGLPRPARDEPVQGHYYGLPLDTNTRVLMYNDAALKAAGIEHPPATFAALEAMAPKLKARGISAFADNGTSGWNVFPWIWSAGGEVTNPAEYEGDRLPQQPGERGRRAAARRTCTRARSCPG